MLAKKMLRPAIFMMQLNSTLHWTNFLMHHYILDKAVKAVK